MRRIVAGLLVTVLLAMSVASCGLSSTDESSSPPLPATTTATSPGGPSITVSPTRTASASDPPATTEPTPADPSQPAITDELGKPVTRRTSRRFTLILYPVQRDGTTSQLNFTLSSRVERYQGGEVSRLLTDGNGSAIDKTDYAADGLQLVDGKHAKLYLVASDGVGHCLCSRDLDGVFVNLGAPVLFSATFAAPPADVTQITVRIPNFGTVSNVPVT